MKTTQMNRFFGLLAASALAATFATGACSDEPAGNTWTGTDTPQLDLGGDEGGGDTTGPDATADTGDDTGGPQPVETCETEADCVDGLDCTVDSCSTLEGGAKVCVWTVAAETCLISHVCRAPGESKPTDPCHVCDPASPMTWTAVDEGGACDDGDACTEATTCQDGECVGTAVVCENTEACATYSCDPAVGCASEPAPDGTPCSDGDGCTVGDACVEGACTGEVLDCDDGDPCTDDACDAAQGCTYTYNEAPCEDGDLCTLGDTCSEGACTTGDEQDLCDDGNICSLDLCDPDVGCVHLATNNPCCIGLASVCDDGDPCTDDVCDPDTGGCSYENNTAPCDDGSKCTENDTCAEGECAGTPVVCDDENVCTVDSCSVSVGCRFEAGEDGISCDDGLECSPPESDLCVAGVCVGDMSDCKCKPTFDDAAKLSSLAIAPDDAEGNALDLDEDGDRDNAFSIFATLPQIADALSGAVTDGTLMLLVEFKELDGDGPFLLAVHIGDLDPTPPNDTCDFQNATCDYLASPDLVDAETCEPVVKLPATLTGNHVVAGGKDTVMPFSIPMGEVSLEVSLFMVRVDVDVTLDGGEVVALDGVLGGVVRMSDLETALEQIPADQLPVPPSLIITMLTGVKDIDTDGDGTVDAISIALLIQGIDGVIVGVAE